jgi:hypothetical protein
MTQDPMPAYVGSPHRTGHWTLWVRIRQDRHWRIVDAGDR